jgi:hypothetical protein
MILSWFNAPSFLTSYWRNSHLNAILIFFLSPTWIFPKRYPHQNFEGWSKISRTEFMVGKRKHLQVTRSYIFQSTTLQIACSDSSDPSTLQCMSGRLVWEWPATAVSYFVYLRDVLKLFPLQGALQPGEEEEVAGGQIWWERRVGNHGDAVLGQEFPDTQGRVAWRIVAVQKPGTEDHL